MIIPVYNCADTIERAINSVLNQRFHSWEIVAVDDGSTDCSSNILEKYGDRIKILRQRNRGAAAARNTGAAVATGEYLAFLDADDEWLPGKLRACVDALDASPHAVAVYSDMLSYNGVRISPMSGSPSLHYLLENAFALTPSATMVRREAFERCGGFADQFAPGDLAEDTFLGLKLRELGEFVHIAEPMVYFRVSGFSEAAAKYPGGHRKFARLVRKRYGRRSRGIRSEMRRYYGSLLLGTALVRAREKRIWSASWYLLSATTVGPSFVIGCGLKKIRKATASVYHISKGV